MCRDKHEPNHLATIAELTEKNIELEDRSAWLSSENMRLQLRMAADKRVHAKSLMMHRIGLCVLWMTTMASLLAALR